MKYISTRGTKNTEYNFMEALLNGMADDGGLYVPKTLPVFSKEKISSFQGQPYSHIAFEVIKSFVGGDIPDNILEDIINDSYKTFGHLAIAPLYQIESNVWVMELFHGPTLAFKDFALQVLGRLLDYALEQQGKRAIVLGATSGDTGSAAIEGCRHSKNMDIVILHPHQRVSEIQRRQMTTVLEKNVHNIAIKGNFDDCQQIVKQCFADQSFLPEHTQLVAVNSINWARIMTQIVYYVHAAVALGAPDKEVIFSVPTGNFGDIYAGYMAKKMGLPVNKLIIATNENNILHRFLRKNDYSCTPLKTTLAPSMDIMVSSNFERLLFDLYEKDGNAVNKAMIDFQSNRVMTANKDIWNKAQGIFHSHTSSDTDICNTMKTLYDNTGYLVDPHTSTAVDAINNLPLNTKTQKVVLATAHPIKFPEAISRSGLQPSACPDSMQGILEKKENYTVLPNNQASIKEYIDSIYNTNDTI